MSYSRTRLQDAEAVRIPSKDRWRGSNGEQCVRAVSSTPLPKIMVSNALRSIPDHPQRFILGESSGPSLMEDLLITLHQNAFWGRLSLDAYVLGLSVSRFPFEQHFALIPKKRLPAKNIFRLLAARSVPNHVLLGNWSMIHAKHHHLGFFDRAGTGSGGCRDWMC